MRDPYYAELIFLIEHMICQADDEAKSKGFRLTDSQVRSAVLKAKKKVQGGEPDIPERNDREKILAGLIDSIYKVREDLMACLMTDDGATKAKPLPVSDWVKALETVEDSIETRRSSVPGSREYLDFVQEFIARVEGSR